MERNEPHAIEVLGVTKRYRVYHDKNTSLKDLILFNRNRYTEHHVLDNVTLSIPWGKTYGIVGANGSGKSTLLKLMTGIIYPDSGEVLINGKLTSLLELGAGFHPEYTGRENIINNAAVFGLSRASIMERVEGIIEFSGLTEYIDSPIRTYSSGMYMRLAFAIAINVDADILLFDEILAVGDEAFQEKCFNRIRELRSEGKTIVIVSHNAGAIQNFCDQALWINNGKIVASGDPNDVIRLYRGTI